MCKYGKMEHYSSTSSKESSSSTLAFMSKKTLAPYDFPLQNLKYSSLDAKNSSSCSLASSIMEHKASCSTCLGKKKKEGERGGKLSKMVHTSPYWLNHHQQRNQYVSNKIFMLKDIPTMK